MESDLNNALVVAIRSKKLSEAVHLITEGASVNVVNEISGKRPLHVAAFGGSTDIVATLFEHGAEVNNTDKNGDTALHIASKCGHENVVVLLAALGADVDLKNMIGHTALYYAVMDKNPRLVEILLKLGIDPCVTEWDWGGKTVGNKEIQILEAFNNQCQFIPGFKHGLIRMGVFYVRQNIPCFSEHLQLEIVTKNVTKSFIVQCYKMQLEYGDVKHSMGRREHYLSDLYEFRTWNCLDKELELQLTVDGYVKENRIVKLVTLDGCIGRINETMSSISESDKTETTQVHAFIRIAGGEYKKFIISSEEERGLNQVPSTGRVIVPEIMTNAELIIPESCFDTEVNLSTKVIETIDINREMEKCIFMTDILAVDTSNIQPNKQVVVKMPIHTKVSTENNVAIMISIDGTSSFQEEWAILKPTSESRQHVSFQTDRLTVFVGVPRSLTMTESGLNEIKSALNKAIANEKRVQFLVFMKKVEDTEGDVSIIVHCVLCRKTRATLELWKKKYYKMLYISSPVVITVNSVFEIVLSGNVEEVFRSPKLELEFHLFRDNFRVFNVCGKTKDMKAEGDLRIQLTKTRSTVEIVGERGRDCLTCGSSRPETRGMDECKAIFSCHLSFDHKDRNVKLNNMFDGFRLIWTKRNNKIVPVG